MSDILIEAQKEGFLPETQVALGASEETIECEGCYSQVQERDLKGGEACPYCSLVIA
jgi:Zn finger protein HypA/HybF involved in hydrogenase expression